MMKMSHTVILILASATLVTAIVAAIYWFKSAGVPTPYFVEPIASLDDAPEQHIMSAEANTGGLHKAMSDSARLNKRAAVWTGVSALLGAVTTAFGTLPQR
jgi:hypothetical protein